MLGNRKQLSLPSRKQNQSMKKSFCFNPQFTDGRVRNEQSNLCPWYHVGSVRQRQGFYGFMNPVPQPQSHHCSALRAVQSANVPCPAERFSPKTLSSSKNKVLVPLHKHSTYKALLHFFFLPSPSQSAKSADRNKAVTDTSLKDIGFSKPEI